MPGTSISFFSPLGYNEGKRKTKCLTPCAVPTASPARPAPTSSSTCTTRSTGSPGARRRSRARAREDKPIFLSIGYAACHWCHVMERESFEDEAIAELLNERFVPIKVDREERPDLDEIYMTAVQMMTGPGRLAAERVPDPRRASRSTAGPTCPPTTATGAPSFPRRADRDPRGVDARAARRWSARPADMLARSAHAGAVGSRHRRCARRARRGGARRRRARLALRRALGRLRRRAEVPAPRRARRCCCASTRAPARRCRCAWPSARSTRMALGGMYDQIGGGFSRYSDGRALARPPLREDALRPGAARAPSTSTRGS